MIKNLPANVGDTGDEGSTPGSGRSSGGHDNPLQYSCPEEPGGLQSKGLQTARHTHTHTQTHTYLVYLYFKKFFLFLFREIE